MNHEAEIGNHMAISWRVIPQRDRWDAVLGGTFTAN
jgi:hypothetical protein